MFVKYTNDNNPFQLANIYPATVMDGLSKVGGFFALFGILKVCLFFYNKGSFEKSLKKRYQALYEAQISGKNIKPSLFSKPFSPESIDD